jgi:cation:H+ antiporter
MTAVLSLLFGLVLLIIGGDLLVRGAVRVAAGLGVSPLVIGLTLVGFGTSMPELVASVQAALAGAPGITLGNIVGSNIANVLLILGVSAVVYPVAVQSRALRRDGVVMVAVTLGFAVLLALRPLDRAAGLLLIAALIAYMVYAIRQERAATAAARGSVEAADHGAAYDRAIAAEEVDPALKPGPASGGMAVPVLIALAGLGLVLVGGSYLVDGAVVMARSLGISETVIGLTIVAVGTSTPELVTSVAAALRRESDIAFGNVVGSNIYNILGIGGVTGVIVPIQAPPELVRFDLPVAVAVAVLLVVFAATGSRVGRREGAALIAGYLAYLWLLWPA